MATDTCRSSPPHKRVRGGLRPRACTGRVAQLEEKKQAQHAHVRAGQAKSVQLTVETNTLKQRPYINKLDKQLRAGTGTNHMQSGQG